MIHLIRVLGLLVSLAGLTSPVFAKPLEDRDWIEVRTPNFRIRSVTGEKDTLKLAKYMESFRAAVSTITNVERVDSPIPIEIYAFGGSRDFSKIGAGHNVAGFFSPSLRNYKIAVRDTSGLDETAIILHEYVHFLMRNHGALQYPRWFDEGFSEYLSATRLRGDSMHIGLPPDARIDNLVDLSWLRTKKILTADNHWAKWSSKSKAMFYAQSWALVAYLQNRQDRSTSVGEDMSRYIELRESGVDEIVAFSQAFGVDMRRIDNDLSRYIRRGKVQYFSLSMDKLLPNWNPEITYPTREQIALGLGQLALSSKEENAERWFTVAASHPDTRAQAEAGLGDLYKFRKEYDKALPHFEIAIDLAPDDAYCQLDMAEYWHDRANNTQDDEQRAAFLKQARRHYVKAWKLDDTMPELYAMYGDTFLLEGTRIDKAIEMLEVAESILPSNLDIRLMLAEAYQKADRKEEALQAVRSVRAWAHYDSEKGKRASKLLDELEGNVSEDSEANPAELR